MCYPDKALVWVDKQLSKRKRGETQKEKQKKGRIRKKKKPPQ